VLRYIAVVEVLNAKINHNLKQQAKIHQRVINAIIGRSDDVLYVPVHAKNKKWLY
jgi:hypothetical protein